MWKEVIWAVRWPSTMLNSFFILLPVIQVTLRDLAEQVKGLKEMFGSSRGVHNHIYRKQMDPITSHQSKLLLCG